MTEEDITTIDLNLCESCPQGYPWVCKACQRNDMGCERPKKEPEE